MPIIKKQIRILTHQRAIWASWECNKQYKTNKSDHNLALQKQQIKILKEQWWFKDLDTAETKQVELLLLMERGWWIRVPTILLLLGLKTINPSSKVNFHKIIINSCNKEEWEAAVLEINWCRLTSKEYNNKTLVDQIIVNKC